MRFLLEEREEGEGVGEGGREGGTEGEREEREGVGEGGREGERGNRGREGRERGRCLLGVHFESRHTCCIIMQVYMTGPLTFCRSISV